MRGIGWYLDLGIDIWIRKIVVWCGETTDSGDLVSRHLGGRHDLSDRDRLARGQRRADHGGLVRATRDRLGVLASLTLPGVSNDNPYSQTLFRKIKYRLKFQQIAFRYLASSSEWVAAFVA